MLIRRLYHSKMRRFLQSIVLNDCSSSQTSTAPKRKVKKLTSGSSKWKDNLRLNKDVCSITHISQNSIYLHYVDYAMKHAQMVSCFACIVDQLNGMDAVVIEHFFPKFESFCLNTAKLSPADQNLLEYSLQRAISTVNEQNPNETYVITAAFIFASCPHLAKFKVLKYCNLSMCLKTFSIAVGNLSNDSLTDHQKRVLNSIQPYLHASLNNADAIFKFNISEAVHLNNLMQFFKNDIQVEPVTKYEHKPFIPPSVSNTFRSANPFHGMITCQSMRQDIISHVFDKKQLSADFDMTYADYGVIGIRAVIPLDPKHPLGIDEAPLDTDKARRDLDVIQQAFARAIHDNLLLFLRDSRSHRESVYGLFRVLGRIKDTNSNSNVRGSPLTSMVLYKLCEITTIAFVIAVKALSDYRIGSYQFKHYLCNMIQSYLSRLNANSSGEWAQFRDHYSRYVDRLLTTADEPCQELLSDDQSDGFSTLWKSCEAQRNTNIPNDRSKDSAQNGLECVFPHHMALQIASKMQMFAQNVSLDVAGLLGRAQTEPSPLFYNVFTAKQATFRGAPQCRRVIVLSDDYRAVLMAAHPMTLMYRVEELPMPAPPVPFTDRIDQSPFSYAPPFRETFTWMRPGSWLESDKSRDIFWSCQTQEADTVHPLLRDRLRPFEMGGGYQRPDCPRLTPVKSALNTISSTAWCINDAVYDIAEEVLVRGEGALDLAIQPHPNVYRKKLDAEFQEWQVMMEANDTPDLEKEQLMKKNDLEKKYNENCGLWSNAVYNLSMARAIRGRPFWLPLNMDYRQRMYTVCTQLTHISWDLSRGLMLFAVKRPLGPQGFDWLLLHLVNLTGTMKHRHLADRLLHAKLELLPLVIDSATRPLNGEMWWRRNEYPWQTLATCMEIAAALRFANVDVENSSNIDDAVLKRRMAEFPSSLPVHQDGTCNGLQHYAALGRDPLGAQSVNVKPMRGSKRKSPTNDEKIDLEAKTKELKHLLSLPITTTSPERFGMSGLGKKLFVPSSSKWTTRQLVDEHEGFRDGCIPSDVYRNVLDISHKLIAQDAKMALLKYPQGCPNSDSLSTEEKYWPLAIYLMANDGEMLKRLVTRQVVKRPVMTTVYGLTSFGMRLQVVDELNTTMPDATYFEQMEMAKYVSDCINRSIVGLFCNARELQHWMVAETRKLCNRNSGVNMAWTTPMGLRCVHPYSSSLADARVHKQCNGIAPNYVHSLDSSHFMMTLLDCHRYVEDEATLKNVSADVAVPSEQLVMTGIHDSYWTHACNVEQMSKATRRQFVRLYKKPLLENLRKEFVQQHRFDDDIVRAGLKPAPSVSGEEIVKPFPTVGELDIACVLESDYFFS